jgi:hypothetical protein
MPKVGITKLTAKSFAGWSFVLFAGLLLALIAIIDGGGLNSGGLNGGGLSGSTTPTAPAITTTAAGAGSCQLQVTIDGLKVRAGPSQDTELLRTLGRGEIVEGTRIQSNLYRQLADGSWASTEFLTPVAGSNCI